MFREAQLILQGFGRGNDEGKPVGDGISMPMCMWQGVNGHLTSHLAIKLYNRE